MRWFYLLLCCAILLTVLAEPDPKKYSSENLEKEKKENKSEALTVDEKTFLREVEEKFGITSKVPVETKKDEAKVVKDTKNVAIKQQKPALPAVIAIEIVNDTDTNTKGKRTIDANLGYGYRTNDGYSYTYFGKSNQEKGKFMIYPYSQEDIPSTNSNHGQYNLQSNKYSNSHASSVEIQPSQAYELVPIKNEESPYTYNKPSVEFKTGYEKASEASSYSSGKAAQTLYTTYNGQGFSDLSGQFPSVMPNYFVDASQLVNNPHYQNAGLTQDHLRTQNSYLNQNDRIVPVLVLRVPSSYLKNPTAELYPDLPKNYPLSQHLNSVNLQGLVNEYLKKNGFSYAPQIMSYQNSNIQPDSGSQQYSSPYVKPTYTEVDYSGVQYSAVKPAVARYPVTYNQQKYLMSQPQSLYQHSSEPQYEYKYKYVPQSEVNMQAYYVQPQYQQETQEDSVPNDYQNEQTFQQQSNLEETSSNVEYESPSYSSAQHGQNTAADYESQSIPQVTSQPDLSHYVTANPVSYEGNNENVDYSKQSISSQYDSVSPSTYEYYSGKAAKASTVSVVPSNLIHSEQYQDTVSSNLPQRYVYQSQGNEDSSKEFVLSENYPSKDHTIATVLPYSYKKQSQKPPQSSVQTVSYVTPMPSAKYQSQYNVMVPQTILRNPATEKVSYVNSQPMHYTQIGHYSNYNSQNNYAASQLTAPGPAKHSYPRNYHAHPKRMAKQDGRPDAVPIRKLNERSEKKKSP